MLAGNTGKNAEGGMSELLFDTRIPARVWDKIIPEPNSGCWLWLGAIIGSKSKFNGYGCTWFAGERISTHRLMYTQFIGKIPIGKEMDHKCRVTLCCNPMHLEPVSHLVNSLRGIAGQHAIEKAKNALICKRGHPWTKENTNKDGGCRICKNARRRWYKANCIGKVEQYE